MKMTHLKRRPYSPPPLLLMLMLMLMLLRCNSSK
jgi:hypothetical protein